MDRVQNTPTRAARIAVLKGRIDKLKRERSRVLGIVARGGYGPETMAALRNLSAVQEKIRLTEDELASLKQTDVAV